MADRRWENLKEIFHAVVALPQGERSAYLDLVCDGDASLRHALESLIKSHEESGFVDQPAYQAAAEMLVDDSNFKPGQTVAHYKILSLLGEGGMGKVYLAEDTKLHRRVAIKALPGASNANKDANRRLLREAQAAAKLDHPNICAVYEVAEEEGRSFIVMPYVEGERLDIRMKRKPLDVLESLAIGAQVANALAEAQAQGIIHRDIKPSNIIINPRGQAKVMDFGLAKLANGAVAPGIDAEASTQVLLTTPGTIIGTVPYMSPEQVHGQALDARTDIFSFGVVLYEMLTGHQLFAAETPAGTISAILTKEPTPLSNYFQPCPRELQRLVNQCLEKDRERRYQTMRDIVSDLENVRRECGAAFSVSINDDATATFKTAATDYNAKLPSFLKSHLSLILIVVGVLAAVVLLYAWFFKSQQTAPTGSITSVNSAAYDYFLRGKLKASSENREENQSAIKILEDVVSKNPSFAPGYAELARAYSIKANYFAPEPEQQKLNEDAKVYVEKALALDPNLAAGHFVRGFLLWTHANRFPHEQAIQSDKRAVGLDPNLAPAHHHLGVMYFHIGLLDKAEVELKQALQINPSDTLARFRLASINVCRGKYEEALAVLKTVPREANAAIVDRATADALLHLGRMQEAADVVENYFQKNSTNDEGGNVTSVKAILLAKAGKNREAEETIRRAIEIGKGFQHFHHTSYNIAAAYALMNKSDDALKWIQFTADDGFPCYPLFEQDTNLNNLRNDERFITFMAKQKQQWEKYKASL